MSSGHIFRASFVLLGQRRVQHHRSQIVDETRIAEGSQATMSKKPSHPRLAHPRRIPKMNAVVSQRATPLKVRCFESPTRAFVAEDCDPLYPLYPLGPLHRLRALARCQVLLHRLTAAPSTTCRLPSRPSPPPGPRSALPSVLPPPWSSAPTCPSSSRRSACR